MGSGLPEAIGACFAHGRKRTICLCGDGSMQLNIQELQTIVHHQLPIKIFVFNNAGYLSIRGTQDGFLKSNYVGSDASGGVSLPDFLRVAEAYGIKTNRARTNDDIHSKIQWALAEPGAVVCELMISPSQEIIPRLGFDARADGTFAPRPLEDMYPYLDRNEFSRNMVVETWSENVK
jgi:acetolactate synthase-1/2/3 large subunit